MSDPTPAEIEAVKVLIAHGRTRIEGCDCGWGMDGSKLGQSHALHVWRELQRAVLPDHDARLREHIAQAIEARIPPGGADDPYDYPAMALMQAAAIARTPEGDTDEQ